MNMTDMPNIAATKPMSLNLEDYVKVYENVFDADFCKKMVDKAEEGNWRTHTFYDAIADRNIQHEDELDVSWSETPEKLELQKKMWHVIEQYVIKDHAHMHSWYSGWAGYTEVRFNRYNVGTQMHIHCDHIHSMFDGTRKGVPTLTILGSLNNDYEGGDLLMWEQKKIHLPAGAVVMFPSNFLYPHRITPVTKGVRYSYVSWVW